MAELPEPRATGGFELRLENFTGPFDLLLGLIAKHELDITDIALAQVTDDFISYIRSAAAQGQEWALDEASEFLVLAATLLDLKAARLLPQGEVEDEADLAVLEARDLLFARLLQYKAFKDVAALLGEQLADEAERFPRMVGLEAHFAALLPELVFKHTPEAFAALAATALAPRTDAPDAPPTVALEHLHAAPVSVSEQAGILAALLAGGRHRTFGALTSDAESMLVVVARFLALLEMFRDGVLAFDQAAPLGELTVRWSAGAVHHGSYVLAGGLESELEDIEQELSA
ncbi:segregation and condensation protein A [Arthrobacter sp. 35W]|uniref:segregation and condensation protein A n=1 Tax=Arthrobacter sp. 35W TaxID=1132441 RepID=UPI0003FCB9BB|nr:ScpA family protein [Arthrobacter sp. 35W]